MSGSEIPAREGQSMEWYCAKTDLETIVSQMNHASDRLGTLRGENVIPARAYACRLAALAEASPYPVTSNWLKELGKDMAILQKWINDNNLQNNEININFKRLTTDLTAMQNMEIDQCCFYKYSFEAKKYSAEMFEWLQSMNPMIV